MGSAYWQSTAESRRRPVAVRTAVAIVLVALGKVEQLEFQVGVSLGPIAHQRRGAAASRRGGARLKSQTGTNSATSDI